MNKFIIEPFIGIGIYKLGMGFNQLSKDFIYKFVNDKGDYKEVFDKTNYILLCFNNDSLTYIELNNINGNIAQFQTLNIFTTPACDVVDKLTKNYNYSKRDPEIPYSYIFPEIQLSLWRPVIEGEEGKYFQTVGIGVKGYYDSIPN